MLIPREVVEEVRARNDIVEVISAYVNLKRAGANYGGLCPFHSEKTPSFTVFPATQSFYCFGCGAGGDAITFIMKSENLDYLPAVEHLAKKAGITITAEEKSERGIGKNRVLKMNLDAAKYFRACLFDPNIGKAGMEYLVGKRELSQSVIKHFGLGFAPDSFFGLTDHMRKLGYTDEELVAAFLCGRSQKTGKLFDLFRNRVIFPVIDTSGNIIAFGGRVMDDSKPKYLNSSDTPGFMKRKNLFALNYARHHCSEQLILCEGYMDVIALHAAGFENAVATLGTALTTDQVRVMTKYTKQVIICYDSDEAGQKATAKATGMLSDAGLDVKILKMNGAKDPDEYIKKYSADDFRRLIGQSRTGFEYKIEAVTAKYDLSIAENKIKAAAELCDYISEIWSGVERDVYISATAKRLGVSADGLKGDVERIRKKKLGAYKEKESREARLGAMGIGDRIDPDAAKNIRASAAEEAVIGLLLVYDEYREGVSRGRFELSAKDFSSDFNRRAFEKIMELQRGDGFVYSMLGEYFTPDEMGKLQSMAVKRRSLSENGSLVFEECIKTVKNEKMLSASDGESGVGDIERLLAAKRQAIKKQK